MDKRLGRITSKGKPRRTSSLHCIAFDDGPASPTKSSLHQTASMANLGHPNTESSFLLFGARKSQPMLSTSGSCYSPVTEDGQSDSSDQCLLVPGLSRYKSCSSDIEAEETGHCGPGKSIMVTLPGGAARPMSEQLDQIAEEIASSGKTNSGSFVSKPLQGKIKKKHLRHPDVDKSKVWSKSTHVKVGKDITHVKFTIYPGITDPLHGSTHTSLLVIAQLSNNQRTEVEQRKTTYKIRVGCEASEDSELKFPEPLTVVFESGEDQVRYHQCLMSRSNLDLCSHDVITLTFNTTITMESTQK